jgi:hypothetical protein
MDEKRFTQPRLGEVKNVSSNVVFDCRTTFNLGNLARARSSGRKYQLFQVFL